MRRTTLEKEQPAIHVGGGPLPGQNAMTPPRNMFRVLIEKSADEGLKRKPTQHVLYTDTEVANQRCGQEKQRDPAGRRAVDPEGNMRGFRQASLMAWDLASSERPKRSRAIQM